MYTAEDTSLGETNYRIFVIWVGFLFAAVKYNSYHHSLVFFFLSFFWQWQSEKNRFKHRKEPIQEGEEQKNKKR